MQQLEIQHHRCPPQDVLLKYNALIFPREVCDDIDRNKFGQIHYTEVLREKLVLGLAITTPRQDGGMQLLSFYIIPTFRNQGVGSFLLTSIAKRIAEDGYPSIHGNYKTFWQYNKAWEKLLLKENWKTSPTDLNYVILDRLPELQREKWISHFKLPAYSELRTLDVQKIYYLSDWLSKSTLLQEMPPDIRPNKASMQTNEECSLLLSIDHDIAGWIIVQDLEVGIAQVSALYIRKKYSKMYPHLGLALMAAAFKRNTTLVKAYFGFRNGNHYMERLIQHRFKNYVTHHQKRRCLKIFL